MKQQKTIRTTLPALLPALLLAAALCLPLAACTNGSTSQTAAQPSQTQTQPEETSNYARSKEMMPDVLALFPNLPVQVEGEEGDDQYSVYVENLTKEDYDSFVSTLIENGFTRSVDRSEYDDSCYFQATTEDRCMGADVSFYDTSTYRDKTSMSATVGFTQYGLGYQAGLRQSQQ